MERAKIFPATPHWRIRNKLNRTTEVYYDQCGVCLNSSFQHRWAAAYFRDRGESHQGSAR